MKQQGFGAQHRLSFSKIFLAESSVFKEENYDYPTLLGSELMTITEPRKAIPVQASLCKKVTTGSNNGLNTCTPARTQLLKLVGDFTEVL